MVAPCGTATAVSAAASANWGASCHLHPRHCPAGSPPSACHYPRVPTPGLLRASRGVKKPSVVSQRAHSKGQHEEGQAPGGGSEGGSLPSPTEFEGLASQMTGWLAAEFCLPEELSRLASWLIGTHHEGDPEQLAPRSDQTTEESDAKRVLRTAAEHYGVPEALQGEEDTVKLWLSNPPAAHSAESGDAQMVARLLNRLLEVYEAEHGEEFQGQGEEQYERLYCLASSILGPSLSRSLLARLMHSYLNI